MASSDTGGRDRDPGGPGRARTRRSPCRGQNVVVTDATHLTTSSTASSTTGLATLDRRIADLLKRDEHGLVAAVVQQHDTLEVLMVGWMDDEALRRTLTEGRVTFWSRSRQEYWRKGDTSGHVQHVRAVRLDCDGDALLVQVDQVGAACHTGDRTCFDARVLAAAPSAP